MNKLKAWCYEKTKRYYIRQLAKRYPKMYVWYLEHVKKVGVDFQQTCGYFKRVPSVGDKFKFNMAGKMKVVYECIEVKYFGDPKDMIDHIYYCITGIEGKKDIKDCDFVEFLKTYEPHFQEMIKVPKF